MHAAQPGGARRPRADAAATCQHVRCGRGPEGGVMLRALSLVRVRRRGGARSAARVTRCALRRRHPAAAARAARSVRVPPAAAAWRWMRAACSFREHGALSVSGPSAACCCRVTALSWARTAAAARVVAVPRPGTVLLRVRGGVRGGGASRRSGSATRKRSATSMSARSLKPRGLC